MAWLADLPSDLVLLTGDRAVLHSFHHVLLTDALGLLPHDLHVLDGAACINPHKIWHRNRALRRDPHYGADRLLVQRAMTPFQWDVILTEALDADLHAAPASLVLAAPLDAQLVRGEIPDWQQEMYLDWHLRFTHDLSRRHHVPVLWSVDLRRLWHRAPILAARLTEAVPLRRHVESAGTGWRIHDQDGTILAVPATPQRRLTDFTTATEPVAQAMVPHAERPRPSP